MSINLKAPELRELKPRIMVCGVGGAGGNAVNNMILSWCNSTMRRPAECPSKKDQVKMA